MDDKIIKYSFWRIRKILENDYDMRIEKIEQGYKATRSRYYVNKYNLINNQDNSVVLSNVTLGALRKVLSKEEYSMKE